MKERAAQGFPTGCRVLGYDFIGGELIVNAPEAAAVRLIYDTYLRVGSLSAVVGICAEKGITGKSGGQIAPESVRKKLTRFAYCGYNSFEGKPYKGHHQPIIDPDEYNLVQVMFSGKTVGRKRKTEPVYLEVFDAEPEEVQNEGKERVSCGTMIVCSCFSPRETAKDLNLSPNNRG